MRVKRDAGHVVICGLKSPKIPPAAGYRVFSKYHDCVCHIYPRNEQSVTFHISNGMNEIKTEQLRLKYYALLT